MPESFGTIITSLSGGHASQAGSDALRRAAATDNLCHKWKSGEIAASHRMNLPEPNLRLSKESTVRANQSFTGLRGSARLHFWHISGTVESEIVRLENCTNTWREDACRSAMVGRA
jgi:hypothetical protein